MELDKRGKTMLFVLGIDAATWKVIKPNLKVLPNFKKLMEAGESSTITLKSRPHSASVWCSMFSGKTPEEHGHKDFIEDGKLQTRADIKVDFIWDVLDEKVDIKALGVPFIYPPYNFNCSYVPVAYGLSWDSKEMEQDMNGITEKAKEILKGRPDVFILVYTMLDKIQHFHWGEPAVLDWYKKVDSVIGGLMSLLDEDDRWIVISDHGFGDWDEVAVHTLPKKTPEGDIKGDHHPEAILITKGVAHEIKQPEDVFYAIKREVSK